MKYQKGQSGNPSGKPQGAKNKPTQRAQKLLKEVIKHNAGTLREDLQEASPSQRVGFLTNLIAYSLTERRVSGREFLPERIERAEVFDGDSIVINVAYGTDEELRQDYINMLRGRWLTVEALDEELQSLRKAVLN